MVTNKEEFPGSVFISDAFDSKDPHSPARLNLPLFLNERILGKKAATFINYNIRKKKVVYSKCDDPPEIKKSDYLVADFINARTGITDCKVPESERFRRSPNWWKLPPNIYQKLDFKKKVTNVRTAFGSKSPRFKVPDKTQKKFWEESEKKLIDFGERKNLPVHACHKQEFSFKGPAFNRAPSTRIEALYVQDPNIPGPNVYNPKSHTIEKIVSKKIVHDEKRVGRFLEDSTIPDKDFLVYKNVNSFEPGPGKYTPEYPTPCIPCFQKSPRKKGKSKCVPAYLRSINGQGHTSVFKSKTIRILEPRIGKDEEIRPVKPVILNLDEKYIRTMENPRREILSKLSETFLQVARAKHIRKIRWNCLYRPVKKRNITVRKKLAFGSIESRWKNDPILGPPAKARAIMILNKPKKAKPYRDLRKEKAFSKIMPLVKSEKKAVKTIISSVKKFCPLPGTELLMEEHDWKMLDFEDQGGLELNPSLYYKEEFQR